MIMKEIKVSIVGKVQMVMFRDFIQRKARSLNLSGTVKNADDGSVEVVAQGSEDNLERLIGYLHKGPLLAHVIRVDTLWREPSESFNSFTIQY